MATGTPSASNFRKAGQALGNAPLDHQVGFQGQDHLHVGLEMGAHPGEVGQAVVTLDPSHQLVGQPQGRQDLRQPPVQGDDALGRDRQGDLLAQVIPDLGGPEVLHH